MSINWLLATALVILIGCGAPAVAGGQCEGGDQHQFRVLVDNQVKSTTFFGVFSGPKGSNVSDSFDIAEYDNGCDKCYLIQWCISNECIEDDHYHLKIYDNAKKETEIGSIRYHPKKETHNECRLNAGKPNNSGTEYYLKDNSDSAHSRALKIKK